MPNELTTASNNYSLTAVQPPPPNARLSLDDRLAQVALSSDEKAEVAGDKAVKTIRDKVIGLLPLGEVVNTLLNYHDEVEADLRERKKERLIEGALEQLDAHGDAIGQLKALVCNPYGSTLLSKVLQIADDYPPDPDLLSHLSAAIAYMAQTDFQTLFSAHKFALGIIERLSPQALTLLGTSVRWPKINYTPAVSSAGRASADWRPAASRQLAPLYGVHDEPGRRRVEHVLQELERDGLIYGKTNGQGPMDIELEQIGKELLPYLNGF